MTTSLAERTCVCGCCAGIAESTPAAVLNLPGLSTLAYRVGTHARFKQSMLVGLSRDPALERLTSREDDDPTIALIDAWAAALDVLTFYQERLANEGFLRTALEQRSIRELARAIGYELGPGVAADTSLAFQLETAAGAPESAVIANGTKVQSVPGQDELPQTFETVEEIEARPEWNSLPVSTTLPSLPLPGSVELYLDGTDTQLRQGDVILLVGAARLAGTSSGDWAVRKLTAVEPDTDADVTRVAWASSVYLDPDYELGPGSQDVHVYALRLRAPLFGHNAPDWKAMPDAVKQGYDGLASGHGPEWPNLYLSKVGGSTNTNRVFLDSSYPQVVEGGWALLRAPNVGDALCEITGAADDSRTDFTMSAKTTRLDLSDSTSTFDTHLRDLTVFAQSEELPLGEWPARDPVWGDTVALAEAVPALPEGRRAAVSGRAAYVKPRLGLYVLDWWLDPGDGSYSVPLEEDDVFRVVKLTPGWGEWLHWELDDGKGKSGTLHAPSGVLVVTEPPEDAEELAETAVIGEPVTDDELQDTLRLAASLENVYDPGSLSIAANVARATHGESRSEPLGGGDASRPFQRFALKSGPLTYTQSGGATGATTTLAVRVNGVLWHEVQALYGHGPRDRVYAVRLDDSGIATVEFGDGATGARLPSGAQNVRADYRVGTGLGGQVGGGRLMTLLGAPLGVKAVTNPLPAGGAEDPEEDEDARRSAPLTVRAFERIVSLDDAEDFAATFAGVGKAQATRLWNGETEVVHITIAGADEQPPTADSTLLHNLRDAVAAKGDPHVLVQIDPFVALPFAVEASVVVDPDCEADTVLASVASALVDEFSFERLAFGQSVALSEVVSAMQHVEGVVGIDLLGFHLVGEDPVPNDVLVAEHARFSGGVALPAQLLTLALEDVTVSAS